MTPLALPIGVLMAGFFIWEFREQYELSSMKSAGISLFRIMLPVMLLALFVALFSWICSDYIIPRSNLKYLSRLHDLKRQKPTLGLDEAVFNDDFYGYTIRIGHKSSNGNDISDILIYDHSKFENSGEKLQYLQHLERCMLRMRKNIWLWFYSTGPFTRILAGGILQDRNFPTFELHLMN